ncbi:MAG TPA: dihydrodipicolinate synthase family protein, partial [Acidobacteriota bacterium]|nr:dihydrodipicolinate synthase family protein [Acidobacteriota bacterium]
MKSNLRELLGRGMVIPAHPLALTCSRRLDERHQRALTRYYLA